VILNVSVAAPPDVQTPPLLCPILTVQTPYLHHGDSTYDPPHPLRGPSIPVASPDTCPHPPVDPNLAHLLSSVEHRIYIHMSKV